MTEKNSDYVLRRPDNDDWKVRITIPGMEGLVEVVTKNDLSLDQMLEFYVKGGFKPASALINFFVREVDSNETVTYFDPPMLLQGRDSDNDLGFLDLSIKTWVKFPIQGKENRITWAKTAEWADDPQVAWGK